MKLLILALRKYFAEASFLIKCSALKKKFFLIKLYYFMKKNKLLSTILFTFFLTICFYIACFFNFIPEPKDGFSKTHLWLRDCLFTEERLVWGLHYRMYKNCDSLKDSARIFLELFASCADNMLVQESYIMNYCKIDEFEKLRTAPYGIVPDAPIWLESRQFGFFKRRNSVFIYPKFFGECTKLTSIDATKFDLYYHYLLNAGLYKTRPYNCYGSEITSLRTSVDLVFKFLKENPDAFGDASHFIKMKASGNLRCVEFTSNRKPDNVHNKCVIYVWILIFHILSPFMHLLVRLIKILPGVKVEMHPINPNPAFSIKLLKKFDYLKQKLLESEKYAISFNSLSVIALSLILTLLLLWTIFYIKNKKKITKFCDEFLYHGCFFDFCKFLYKNTKSDLLLDYSHLKNIIIGAYCLIKNEILLPTIIIIVWYFLH